MHLNDGNLDDLEGVPQGIAVKPEGLSPWLLNTILKIESVFGIYR